jgi:hypothetical protein
VPDPAEGDAPSWASEWELRRSEERGMEMRRRDEEMGAEVEEHLEFLPAVFASLSTVSRGG